MAENSKSIGWTHVSKFLNETMDVAQIQKKLFFIPISEIIYMAKQRFPGQKIDHCSTEPSKHVLDSHLTSFLCSKSV